MKKIFFLCFLISTLGSVSAQTIVNRFPIELKKSSDYFQIFNAENDQKEYFAFIADKEKITVLKYNSFLFLKDSISVARPNRNLDFMVGVTFTTNGNPNLYWASKDYEMVKMILFDFKTRTTSDLDYEINFTKSKIIDSFVAKNTLNVVSLTSENTLKITHFSNTGQSEHLLTFAPEQASASKSDAELLANAILDKGISIVQTHQFNPLYVGTSKVKRYLQDGKYILSYDSEFSTTLLTIDISDFSSRKELYPYEKLDKTSGSNSFLHNGILYQFTANSESVSLMGIDLKTKNSVGKYQTSSKQEIDFKNSPLLLQSDRGKAKEFKNTAKFLSKLDFENLGLSVYSTPNYNLFTIGGIREVASGGGLALAIGMGIGGVMSGGDVVFAPDLMNNNLQSIYFESFFDTDFKHLNAPSRPLYVDALGDFLNTNRLTAQHIFPYPNYVILNYYDPKTKEFVMRKFEDVTE